VFERRRPAINAVFEPSAAGFETASEILNTDQNSQFAIFADTDTLKNPYLVS
jgi:hypothetical protein